MEDIVFRPNFQQHIRDFFHYLSLFLFLGKLWKNHWDNITRFPRITRHKLQGQKEIG